MNSSEAMFVTESASWLPEILYVRGCDPNRGAHSSSPASLSCSACVCASAQPLKYHTDSNQILADVSGRQTDQWRLPVRGSDPGLSGSLAVHPPWRLRSVRAGGGWDWGGDWRLTWVSGGIFRGDERLTYETGKSHYQRRPLLSTVQIQTLMLYMPKQE